MKKQSLFIDISDVKKIYFNSGKSKREIEKVRKENEELIENSKVDRQNMHLTFYV